MPLYAPLHTPCSDHDVGHTHAPPRLYTRSVQISLSHTTTTASLIACLSPATWRPTGHPARLSGPNGPTCQLSYPHWPPRHLSLPDWPPRHLSLPNWPPRHLSLPDCPPRHLSPSHWPPGHLSLPNWLPGHLSLPNWRHRHMSRPHSGSGHDQQPDVAEVHLRLRAVNRPRHEGSHSSTSQLNLSRFGH